MKDEHREKFPQVINVDAVSDRPSRCRALAPLALPSESPCDAPPVDSYRDVLASIGGLKFSSNPRPFESKTQAPRQDAHRASFTTSTRISGSNVSGHTMICSTTVVVTKS